MTVTGLVSSSLIARSLTISQRNVSVADARKNSRRLPSVMRANRSPQLDAGRRPR
jgi:hypothetical protein